jgi:transposase-like protein
MRSSHVRETKEVRPGVREGAVRIVRQTGKPIAHVARDLGINDGTLGHWYAQDRATGEPPIGGHEGTLY